MGEILIFAGTTEGRKLSAYLTEKSISHHICIATEYGEIVLKENAFAKVHRGRMTKEEIKEFLAKGNFSAVVDATHPFAEKITHNIKEALDELGILGNSILYLRLKRDCRAEQDLKNLTYFETNEACAEALAHTEGNILLTTGSRELFVYCISDAVKDRLYVRVLPCPESISCCLECGIRGKQVIAMQGPFTAEMNEAVIHQYHISCLVTKESGISGGYTEKLQAAEKTGIQVFVIRCPKESGGYSFDEVCSRLESGYPFMSKKLDDDKETVLEITLAGVGMGDGNCLTKEVEEEIQKADLLLGSERMLKNCCSKAPKYPFYQAKQIIPFLKEVQKKAAVRDGRIKAAVLFSGDSGFYSGCQPAYTALKEEICAKRIEAAVRILPGISSVAYLAAFIGESYQDAAICSIHGKERESLIGKIRHSPKTFVLMSGVSDVNWLGSALIAADMEECEIVTGYQMSYQEQKIETHKPSECLKLKAEGLYTCFVRNQNAVERMLAHGIPDAEFIRDKIPMTKEEVREVSICKLRLREKSVVYDIGSGTGSVAVEMACLSDHLQVYAVEQKKEASALIKKNMAKFGLKNITVVEKAAPDALSGLPAATHAFIGGSGGRLKEILDVLKQKNPRMRVVINAVSIETFCEIKEILSMYQISGEDLVLLQANKSKKAGNYHLMQAGNPVWIFAFDFAEDLAEGRME